MDKKGIEGLPLKYVVIILVAAIVISMILETLGVLREGILHSIGVINQTLNSTVSGI